MNNISNVKNKICGCEGECFAKGELTGKCGLLLEAYESGCPFQKEKRLFTDGKYYAYRTYKRGEECF